MADIEKRVRTRARRGTLKRALLQAAALAGILSVAMVAPNMLKSIPKDQLKFIFARSRNTRGAAVSRLVKDGLLTRDTYSGIRVLRITERGEKYLARERRKYQIGKPPRWDHKWRAVIFDIRERHRHTRNLLRRELRSVGFLKVQDSVWVFPYACEEFIALLKSDLRVGKDILYLVIEEIENDRWIRRHFGLSNE